MLYMATVSFSGKISMAKDEVGEISDLSLVDDLLKAGYVIPYEATSKGGKTEKKPTKTSRKGNTNG